MITILWIWLDFPLWLLIISSLLFWVAVSTGLWILFQNPWLRPFWRSFKGVTASYFASIGILFALSISFMSADIWLRRNQVNRAIIQEASHLSFLLHLSETIKPDNEIIKSAGCAYVLAVKQQEWPMMETLEGEASPNAEIALKKLLVLAIVPQFANPIDPALHRELSSAIHQIRIYRIERLQVSNYLGDSGRWILVIFLGVMTQISIGVVHLEHSRAQALTLLIFTVTIAVALALLASIDQHFTPPFGIRIEGIGSTFVDLAEQCQSVVPKVE